MNERPEGGTEDVLRGFVLPDIDEWGEPFWAGAANGELRVQACGACGAVRFPPRPMCPRCQSTDDVWQVVSGEGTIWSFIVPHPPVLPEFADLAPFNVVVVALREHEGVRMVGNLVPDVDGAIDAIDPAEIRIGAPVRAVFPEVAPGLHLLRWVPTDG